MGQAIATMYQQMRLRGHRHLILVIHPDLVNKIQAVPGFRSMQYAGVKRHRDYAIQIGNLRGLPVLINHILQPDYWYMFPTAGTVIPGPEGIYVNYN
jgi:hypothetical protein